MESGVCGFQVLAASGVVGVADKAVDVAGTYVLSGATAANPFFKNGSSVAAPTVFQAGPTTISQGNLIPITNGDNVRFPLGCYVSFDANTTTVTVFYQQALI